MHWSTETFHHTCKKLRRPVTIAVKMEHGTDEQGNAFKKPVRVKRCSGSIDCGATSVGHRGSQMHDFSQCCMDLEELVEHAESAP